MNVPLFVHYRLKNYWTVFNTIYINRFLETRLGFVTSYLYFYILLRGSAHMYFVLHTKIEYFFSFIIIY